MLNLNSKVKIQHYQFFGSAPITFLKRINLMPEEKVDLGIISDESGAYEYVVPATKVVIDDTTGRPVKDASGKTLREELDYDQTTLEFYFKVKNPSLQKNLEPQHKTYLKSKTFTLRFVVADKPRISQNTGNQQLIDKNGVDAWGKLEDSGLLTKKYEWKKFDGDSARIARIGEVDLINFFAQLFNRGTDIVSFDDKTWTKICSGDVSPLEELLISAFDAFTDLATLDLKAVFGITDKGFQSVYTKLFTYNDNTISIKNEIEKGLEKESRFGYTDYIGDDTSYLHVYTGQGKSYAKEADLVEAAKEAFEPETSDSSTNYDSGDLPF
jgi:hypothetical protein